MATIDLRDEIDSVAALTAEFIQTVGRRDADKPYGLYYVAGESDFAMLPKFVERQVFWERFENDASTMSVEYDPFDAFSTFVLVVDHEMCEPIGASRIIESAAPAMKSLVDIEATPAWGITADEIVAAHELKSGRAGLTDIATIAVRSDAVNRQPTLTAGTLLHGMFRLADSFNTESFIAIIDDVAATLVQLVGVELVTVCDLPSVDFLGSPDSRPILISAQRMRELIALGPPAATTFLASTYVDQCSLPPIDLRVPPAHPVAWEPQFRANSPTHSLSQLSVDTRS